jgi:hypothetical protein
LEQAEGMAFATEFVNPDTTLEEAAAKMKASDDAQLTMRGVP